MTAPAGAGRIHRRKEVRVSPLRLRSALAPLAGVALLAALPAQAADAPKDTVGKDDLNSLGLEVAALQLAHQMGLTTDQMEAFAKLAKDAAPKDAARKPAKVSDKYRKTLQSYHDALIKGDDDRIDDLGEELEDLRDSEDPDLDDRVETTDEARKLAPRALKLLGARQTAAYLGLYGDDLPDPVEDLLAALDKSHDPEEKDWKGLRDDTVAEVGWLVAGFDKDAAGKASDKAGALLDRARGLKDEEFKTQRPQLEKEARDLAVEVGATEVLRHILERDLAELLANPRLPAALDARVKEAKK
jgi:hypothetical protein